MSPESKAKELVDAFVLALRAPAGRTWEVFLSRSRLRGCGVTCVSVSGPRPAGPASMPAPRPTRPAGGLP